MSYKQDFVTRSLYDRCGGLVVYQAKDRSIFAEHQNSSKVIDANVRFVGLTAISFKTATGGIADH